MSNWIWLSRQLINCCILKYIKNETFWTKFTCVDLKDELNLGRQILGNGKGDISRKESKIGKN